MENYEVTPRQQPGRAAAVSGFLKTIWTSICRLDNAAATLAVALIPRFKRSFPPSRVRVGLPCGASTQDEPDLVGAAVIRVLDELLEDGRPLRIVLAQAVKSRGQPLPDGFDAEGTRRPRVSCYTSSRPLRLPPHITRRCPPARAAGSIGYGATPSGSGLASTSRAPRSTWAHLLLRALSLFEALSLGSRAPYYVTTTTLHHMARGITRNLVTPWNP